MLPNLQLLEGAINNEKRASMPREWLSTHLSDPMSQQNYSALHELGEIPTDLQGFEAFCAARKDRLRNKLTVLLGGVVVTPPSVSAE
jgi:hypothetical protein